ncbi:A-kinase anchor protein 9-like isoform X1 [Lates japonicus]|uniref:A-kinase anchor protein 9-like isoform X1 n=1 Tax=Lates japonicus TaxID=270547 RepID=A0AAD3QVA9_LATJO|nr:A-kinase anchor protein 9-like isoform X1 [Lates japonicus]
MISIDGERECLSQMRIYMDRKKAMFLNEKDKLEKERSQLMMMREHPVMSKMKVVESLRVKLQQLKERMSDDIKHKMERLQQNNEDMLTVWSVLEEKCAEFDGQKENMDCYTELLEREKEGLISILSDMVIQKEHVEHLWKQKFTNEKLHLDKLRAELKEEREELDRVNEMMKMMNKEKLNLEADEV